MNAFKFASHYENWFEDYMSLVSIWFQDYSKSHALEFADIAVKESWVEKKNKREFVLFLYAYTEGRTRFFETIKEKNGK